jgi:hypothetical protein
MMFNHPYTLERLASANHDALVADRKQRRTRRPRTTEA